MSLCSIYKNMKDKTFKLIHNNGKPVTRNVPRVRMSKKERIRKRWEWKEDERFEKETNE